MMANCPELKRQSLNTLMISFTQRRNSCLEDTFGRFGWESSSSQFSSDRCSVLTRGVNGRQDVRSWSRTQAKRWKRYMVRLGNWKKSSDSTLAVLSWATLRLTWCLKSLSLSRLLPMMTSATFRWNSFFLILELTSILLQTTEMSTCRSTVVLNHGCEMR